MYLCICKAVTERRIIEEIEDGAHTIKALRHELGVTSECGKCKCEVQRCIDETLGVTEEPHADKHHKHHHHGKHHHAHAD